MTLLIKVFFVSLLTITLGILFLHIFSSVNLLSNQTSLEIDMTPYKKAELAPSSLPARKWMDFAIFLEKKNNFPPPSAARLYAYVASVYADTLEESENNNQANFATGQILKILLPTENDNIDTFLEHLESDDVIPTQSTQKLVDIYTNRINKDNFTTPANWKFPDPQKYWYIRNNTMDKASKAGSWLPWIVSNHDTFSVPPPPTRNSLEEKLELEKVKYATLHRTPAQIDTIYFWHGASGFIKGQAGDNVTPAGVWQNILYVEEGKNSDNLSYAKAQKILAQSIADSFIICWNIKYTYWEQRPSMMIQNLYRVVDDPPFPSYVSGHAAISSTASTILSALYPEKTLLWNRLSQDARNSRLIAGIHFDNDNQMGNYLGQKVGIAIQKKLMPNKKLPDQISLHPNQLFTLLNYFLLKSQTAVQNISNFLTVNATTLQGKYFGQFTEINDSHISYSNAITGISFVDYDHDKKLDIFISGKIAKLYHNEGNGKFTDRTKSAKISGSAMAGIFGDYDNDGCEDLYIVKQGKQTSIDSPGAPDSLYHNNCNGTFTNVTKKSGISDMLHGYSASWADYDNDGYLDLYVTNYGIHTNEKINKEESNILYHNNRDGTFTNVTEKMGVFGASECYKDNFFMTRDTGKKESFQPIWFDYNNDRKIDLFVTNDRGINVLYQNTGDNFKDITFESGLCLLGTGMGVTIGDYDNDMWSDIYVTNITYNYLYHNNHGKFTENATKIAQIDTEGKDPVGWGTSFFDYDNDGYLDIYSASGIPVLLGAGNHKIILDKRDFLFKNNGHGSFNEVAIQEGMKNENYSKRAAAFGDYNNDGFIDIALGSDQQNNQSFHIYKNKENKNNWITIRLKGTKSNRDSIGAKIILKTNGQTQMREIINGSSFSSQNSLWQTFGIGNLKHIDSLEVIWPSGIKKVFKNLSINTVHDLSE